MKLLAIGWIAFAMCCGLVLKLNIDQVKEYENAMPKDRN
ncbi:hypothetical protein GGD61_000784 [Bradyrhizobium sp. SBR1B]|nr:hypothetical protein [Bradyrhizobium sp. SBR1B]